jgi:hypothetical protein
MQVHSSCGELSEKSWRDGGATKPLQAGSGQPKLIEPRWQVTNDDGI